MLYIKYIFTLLLFKFQSVILLNVENKASMCLGNNSPPLFQVSKYVILLNLGNSASTCLGNNSSPL